MFVCFPSSSSLASYMAQEGSLSPLSASDSWLEAEGHKLLLHRAFCLGFSHTQIICSTPSKLGRGSCCGQLTCLSHAAAAFQDAGGVSDPLEPQWSTRRTGCHWHFPGNWGRELDRWWHCELLLHMGLGAESDMPGGEGIANRSDEIGLP